MVSVQARLLDGNSDGRISVGTRGEGDCPMARSEPDIPPAQGKAAVALVAYDASWPRMFNDERADLKHVLGPWLVGEIEHIGSTAVAGLNAKPMIDIMAPVRNLYDSRAAIDMAATLGYCYFPYRPTEMHWPCKPSPAFRTHHLHLVPEDSARWRQRLAFRDALRENPALAAEYAALKHRLAKQFRDGREAYTEAKSGFVNQVLAAVGASAAS